MNKQILVKCFFSFFLALIASFSPASSFIPGTGTTNLPIPDTTPVKFKENLQGFVQFLRSDKLNLGGIYIQNILAIKIVAQPPDNPGFVSSEENTVTSFSLASQFGSIGLLAHNTLAGDEFSRISLGDVIYKIESTGVIKSYQVTEILKYQAVIPNSPYSDFVNLSDPVSTISAQTLFQQTYAQAGKLILQTCIESEGNPNWGRLFIIAEPTLSLPIEMILDSPGLLSRIQSINNYK